MICVTVEIREGTIARRVQYTSSSIKRALELARGGKPGRRVRLVFPIEPETFFVPEESSRPRVPAMRSALETSAA
jgi:hypothetical protein